MIDFPSGQRLDRRWLDSALYPEAVTVCPRFQDLDPLGHINNVAMAAMFEDARVRFNHPMRDHFQTDQIRTLVAGQTLNYLNECYLRPDLTFRLGIGHIGSTSWVMQAAAWQGERPVLLAMATLVSTQDGRPCSVPEGLRDMLEARRMSQPS